MNGSIRYGILLALLLLLTGACSQLQELTPSDRQYLFLPQDIDPYPFTGYVQKKAWGNADYLLFTKRDPGGFRGIYGTILVSPEGKPARFLCLVQVLDSKDDAQDLFDIMTPERRPRMFGRELTVAPSVYGADTVYLYVADSGYFHLIVKAASIVYTVLVDGQVVNEPQVRRALLNKLNFIRQNLRLFR